MLGLSLGLHNIYGIYSSGFNTILASAFTFFSIINFGKNYSNSCLIFIGDIKYYKFMTNKNFVAASFIIFFYVIFVSSIYSGYLLSIIQENVRFISIYESKIFERKYIGEKLKG